jgi:hypothetical protein
LTKTTIELQEEVSDNFYIGKYEECIVEKANIYHIPIMISSLDITKLALEIDDYEWLLDRANDRGIDWDTSRYDPVGLEQVIAEAENIAEKDQRNYLLSIRSIYQYSR